MRLVELLKKLARESDAPTTPIQQKLEDWQASDSDQSLKNDSEVIRSESEGSDDKLAKSV